MNRPPLVLPITPGLAEDSTLASLEQDLKRLRAGGAGGVLLREPRLSDRAAHELAVMAREIFEDGWLAVHDRAHVAISVGADAVHLGFRSLAPAAAREVCGGAIGVGHSHHFEELLDEGMQADYRLLGPIYPTPSKAGILDPLGPGKLLGTPLAPKTWAVGGIGPVEAPLVLDNGVAGVACIGSVFGGGDPQEGIERMLAAVEGYE